MDEKPIDPPLRLTFGGGNYQLKSVREAHDLLTAHWPEDARGPRHRDAVGTCLKVLDGHRSTVEAVEAVKQAAKEAGIRVG